MSTPALPGFFRQYVNVLAHNLLPIVPATSHAEATLVEPLAVVLHSLKIGSYHRGYIDAFLESSQAGFFRSFSMCLVWPAWLIKPAN